MDKDSDAEEAKEIVNWLYGTEAHDMSEGLARTLQDRIASALQSKQSIIDGLESKLAGYSGWSPHQFRGVCKKLEALQKKYIELDNKRFKLESDLELAKQLNARYKEALEEFDKDPHPESIFHPLTADDWKATDDFCKSKGWRIDNVSAEIGRKLYAWIRKKAKALLSEVKTSRGDKGS